MTLRQKAPQPNREPTIALINIVFLMLVFFLIAGSVAPQLDPRVRLVETSSLDGRAPPNAAVILANGAMEFRGAPITPEGLVALDLQPRIIPDRDLPAQRLVAVANDLRRAGAEEVWIVTEQGLE